MSRENCPRENIGRIFGFGHDFALEGSVISPNYCVVTDNGKCRRHDVSVDNKQLTVEA